MLEVHRFGADDGAPLLAMHGVTGHGGRYRTLAQHGLPERRWLAVDLRGHGRSTWDAPWTSERHVADLLETLDAEGVERCDVIGHSFGGLLATHLAATVPERVGRVVLLDPAVALNGHEMLDAAEQTRHDEGWESRDEALRARSEGRPPQALPHVEADLDEALEQSSDGRWRLRYCRSAVVTAWSEIAREPARLGGYQGELLLVSALQDGTVTEALVEALRRDLDGRLTEREIEAGHMIYWDAFDELVAMLRPVLAA
ncbi:MAG: lipase [Gaiellales bacterium]|nr:lipase [Gaiellales bacterium]